MMLEELLILKIQLLELVREVVLEWKRRATTPMLIGALVGGGVVGSNVHILGGSILRDRGLILRRVVGNGGNRKALNPLDTAGDPQQVHLRERLFSETPSATLLCAILIEDLEIVGQTGDEWGAVEGRQSLSTLVHSPRHHRSQVESMVLSAYRVDEVEGPPGQCVGTFAS
ncbi:unnamed protein product [Linum trigynum]|uniref:Uncharacterized protein n=1 Tax=Linum trigynum TaxID=586398 RepID=A0AAV2E946_9ROSI